VVGSLRGLVERLRARRRGEAIPLAELRSFAGAARRTRIVRLVLAAALVAAAVGALVTAPGAEGRRFLPARSVGVVVLDLSSSVQPTTYFLIEEELKELVASGQRFGLVLFSDVAYEALPPGTPSSELRPLLRFFTPKNYRTIPTDALGNALGRSPWEQWFSGGTSISSGLQQAERMLEAQHVRRGAVVLVSDLADDPTDLGRVASVVVSYQQNKIPLSIVALNPSQDNLRFFQNLLGDPALLTQATLPKGEEAHGTVAIAGGFPAGLAACAAALLVLLAANEWWAEPLRFRRRAR
jgi:hypothetical protein